MTCIRTLLVDDDPHFSQIAHDILTLHPMFHLVAHAQSGEEAVEVARKLCPDLILMDIRLPRMNGLAATARIKRVCPQSAVILVTGHALESYQTHGRNAGAIGLISKEDFGVERITELLEESSIGSV